MRLARPVVVLIAMSVSGCQDSEQARIDQLEKILPHVRTMPEGKHPAYSLPPEVRLPRLNWIVVDHRGRYAFEFSSEMTIDANPAYVFVDSTLADPESHAKAICKTSALAFSGSIPRPGWYRAHGQ